MQNCVDCETTIDAAENGHLNCLDYLHKIGLDWDEFTCAWAALGGHLDCLMYAREKGCPWDKRTCAWAAEYGQLECVRYAHENNCPCEHLQKIKKYNVSLDSPTDNTDDQCSICLENIPKVQYKPCNHRFCIKCTNTLINAANAAAAVANDDDDDDENKKFECPLCRADVEENFLLDN